MYLLTQWTLSSFDILLMRGAFVILATFFLFFYSAVPAFFNKMRVSSGINAQMSHSWSKLWLQVNQKNLEVFFDKGWRGRYPTENTFKNIFHNTVSHSIHVTDVYFNSTSHIFLFFWITHFHRIQRAPEEPLHLYKFGNGSFFQHASP